MKTLLVLLPLFVVVLARPQHGDADAQITKYNNDNIGVEGYSFEFETSNGIAHQESGKLDNPESEDANMNVQGAYSYTDPTGKKISVVYTAGPNGYEPKISIA